MSGRTHVRTILGRPHTTSGASANGGHQQGAQKSDLTLMECLRTVAAVDTGVAIAAYGAGLSTVVAVQAVLSYQPKVRLTALTGFERNRQVWSTRIAVGNRGRAAISVHFIVLEFADGTRSSLDDPNGGSWVIESGSSGRFDFTPTHCRSARSSKTISRGGSRSMSRTMGRLRARSFVDDAWPRRPITGSIPVGWPAARRE